MYAIVRTGGKQYRVQPGDVIRVEKLDQDLGAEFDITDVLMVGGDVTAAKGSAVTVVVTRQTKDKKVIIFKKKRRQGYRRFKTHRQPYTELFVKAISAGGKVVKAESQPTVVDFDKVRAERIAARSDKSAQAKKAADSTIEKVAKKTAKKAPAKKKAATKSAKKPAAKKKVAKKTTKK